MERLEKWAKRLVDECREALSSVLPITKPEREFLDLLLDRGEIRPDALGLSADLPKSATA